MSSIVDAARKGEWSGVDCSVLSAHPRIIADQPPVLLPLGAVHLLGQGLEKRKKITFDFSRLKVTAITSSSSISTACYQYWLYVHGGKIFGGEICVKSTQGEILPNPVVYNNAIENTKYLTVTTTLIGTIERGTWKKMTRHCKLGKI